jgi:hypothetical protein
MGRPIVGGVLIANAWDHHTRKSTAKNFTPELTGMEDRHHRRGPP